MTTEITTPQSFEDKMKTRIKESIGDLITDEELKKLIDRAMTDVFFTPRKGSHYNSPPLPPFLHEIVQAEMKDLVRTAVSDYIRDHKDEVVKVVGEVIQAGMGAALVEAFRMKFSGDLHNFQMNLMNSLGRS